MTPDHSGLRIVCLGDLGRSYVHRAMSGGLTLARHVGDVLAASHWVPFAVLPADGYDPDRSLSWSIGLPAAEGTDQFVAVVGSLAGEVEATVVAENLMMCPQDVASEPELPAFGYDSELYEYAPAGSGPALRRLVASVDIGWEWCFFGIGIEVGDSQPAEGSWRRRSWTCSPLGCGSAEYVPSTERASSSGLRPRSSLLSRPTCVFPRQSDGHSPQPPRPSSAACPTPGCSATVATLSASGTTTPPPSAWTASVPVPPNCRAPGIWSTCPTRGRTPGMWGRSRMG